MSNIAQQAANMIDILPENEKLFAFELIKKLVLAWDPDYTKTTDEERSEIEVAEKEIANGEFVLLSDISW